MEPTRAWLGVAKALARETRANVVVLFGIAAPLLFAAAGAATDYVVMSNLHTKMQSVADAAALNAAHELNLAQTSPASVGLVAQNYATSMLAYATPGGNPQITASVIDNNTAVQVDIAEDYYTSFMRALLPKVTIRVHAVGRVASGSVPICLLALDDQAPGTIYLEADAKLTATNCAVYSDSRNPQGMKSTQSAVLTSLLTCTAGGKVGNKINFNPDPVTDCPQVADPLASRSPPDIGPCSASGKVVDGLTVTLNPGTYCGGLSITGAANVTLSPGVFVIKDGPFVVDGGSQLQGNNSGIYLTGAAATLLFGGDTTINMTAPKEGPLAGILIFEDRSAPLLRQHQILSDNARTLLGTIYIPGGRLIVNATKPIADKSAYTIIVTRRMELYAGPNLVLNTDYQSTDIPVPNGVGPTSQKTFLSQ